MLLWRLGGRGHGAALTETAKPGGNGHGNSRSKRHQIVAGRTSGLCERGNGHAKHRERHKSILHCGTHDVAPCFLRISRQWVVDAHRAGALTLPGWYCWIGSDLQQSFCVSLVLVRDGLSHINGGEQHEHIRLDQGNAQVQSKKNYRQRHRNQREADQRQQIAGVHVGK